jgi:hypothetical protein
MRLPTPEVLRETLGSSFPSGSVHQVAALVLQVDGVRREAWSGEAELAVPLFEKYPPEPIPAPEIGAPGRSHKRIDDAVKTETRRCSTCVIRAGFQPCTVCVGTGAGGSDPTFPHCIACSGEGFVKCSACEGTTRVVACSIRYVNDAPVRIRRALVPPVDSSVRSFIEARIRPDATWSNEHAFDPEPVIVASAYRGAESVRAPEDFRGFYFGEALASCIAARSEATTGLARFVARVYAVPILWVLHGSHHRAFFFDESGAVQSVP